MQILSTFPAQFAPIISSSLNRTQFAKIIGAKRPGKCALILHSCISVTDRIKINERNKSIAIGPLYIHTKFEVISMLLPENVAVLNPVRYLTS